MRSASLIRALRLVATLLAVSACDDPRPDITEAAEGALPGLDLITLRPDLLACAKVRLDAGDASLRPALDRLIAAAETALTEPPVTVTDKKRLPPSGDQHDYVSLATYWWPDPNRPDGLPYIPRDGYRNPEVDDGERYDRRRLQLLTNHINTLALAYHFTGREEFAQHAAAYARTWFIDPATRTNPHLQYAQEVPGVRTGSAHGIIEMRYLPRVLDALELLRPSNHWSADDREVLEEWLVVYLDWVWNGQRGQYVSSRQTNHGSWYDVQVAGVALFLGRSIFARRVIASHSMWRIEAQIEHGGSQPEELRRTRSLYYSIFNLRALMQLAELARRVDLDLWNYEAPSGGSIRAALNYLVPYADPANQWPKQEARPVASAAMLEPLRMGELVYGDPEYGESIARIPEEDTRDHRVQLLYPPPSTVNSCSRLPRSR